jgi:hypothetical protein
MSESRTATATRKSAARTAADCTPGYVVLVAFCTMLRATFRGGRLSSYCDGGDRGAWSVNSPRFTGSLAGRAEDSGTTSE